MLDLPRHRLSFVTQKQGDTSTPLLLMGSQGRSFTRVKKRFFQVQDLEDVVLMDLTAYLERGHSKCVVWEKLEKTLS